MESQATQIVLAFSLVSGGLFFTIERGKPWLRSNLITGVLFVIVAMSILLILTYHKYVIEIPIIKSLFRPSLFQKEKADTEFWLIAFPLIYGGMGISLISAWFTTSEPKIVPGNE